MHRIRACYIPLLLFFLLLSGCDRSNGGADSQVDLTKLLPENSAVGSPKRLDVDEDGIADWLIFYRLSPDVANPQARPIATAVYRSVADQDERLPPQLVPELVLLPNRLSLCQHTCEAAMEDVISAGPTRKELVIRDRRDTVVVGVSIFGWQEDSEKMRASGGDTPGGQFVPLGHFRADSVAVNPDQPDQVATTTLRHDRGKLAIREIYRPQSGHYYRQEMRRDYEYSGQILPPDERFIIFAAGLPADPVEVKFPEQLVLAFYLNFGNVTETQRYFTAEAWGRLGQDCPDNRCGCSSNRADVSRVMVTGIANGPDLKETTRVLAEVICVTKDGIRDPHRKVLWMLQRQDQDPLTLSLMGAKLQYIPAPTWLLSDAVLIP